MTEDFEHQVTAAIDSGFERIAHQLDQIASGYGLKSGDMSSIVADTDFSFLSYYKDWMEGTWEKDTERLA